MRADETTVARSRPAASLFVLMASLDRGETVKGVAGTYRLALP